ncbi:putative polypeptide N-acetylgalactosaminyltransferase 9 [Toxorhynchites rutilus septentrionalis]|uniref:putative polypeptide N-acetylgalactosaminyltransferase 9 n=1 Tax=Toxorhynchites rutilus septentrionalis TaxID=329112 RepID=UPI00247AD7B9|nr:putative polypeptide N-acetylgalactosaminyltransferase 9 [Toxorhynchites rutilus septentrionalis]
MKRVFNKKLLLCVLFSVVSVLGVITLYSSSWEISIFQQELIAEQANYDATRVEPWTNGSAQSTEDFVYVSPTLDPRIAAPPGDMGVAVTVGRNNSEIAALIKRGYDTQGLNQYLSDLMSVRRRLPDVRDNWCKEPGRFRSDLPKTSIVIVFYNEAWSVLVRTVHSILDRTPPKLVKEIILVDDFSYLPHTKTQLDDYVRSLSKVRILRASERQGLIRARLLGARNSTAPVITFLDAHVECTVGWLEALLDSVVRNWTTIAIPTIDWIDEHDMHLRTENAPSYYGAYDWDLNFGWWGRWSRIHQPKDKMEPFDTPAMAGGLFSISRAFFERLGWYDEGFDIYGIENIELSMKSWICGGKMVTVPCSRVAHIQKTGHPYLTQTKKDVVRANSLRLAEVWMDEYKQVIFDIYGIPKYPEDELGDVSARKEVRRKAKCKTFRYYIENAFPEMRNPLVKGAFHGEVKNRALGNETCLHYDATSNSASLAPCNHKQSNQYWTHNYYQELNSYKHCLDYTGSTIAVFGCHRSRGNQAWEHLTESGQLRSVKHGKCLAVNLSTNKTLIMEDCSDKIISQKWWVTLVDLDVSFFKQPE